MNEINDRKSIVIKSHSFNSGPKDKEGAVLLIRNPFDAALAEFNRAGHGHTGHASTKAFKSEKWVSHCSKIYLIQILVILPIHANCHQLRVTNIVMSPTSI